MTRRTRLINKPWQLCILVLLALASCGEQPPVHSNSDDRAANSASPPASGLAPLRANRASRATAGAIVGASEAGPRLTPEEEAFGNLLSEIVDEDGYVRYEALAREPHAAQLRKAVENYEVAPPPDTDGAKKALWCNAYNANVLAMIAQQQRQTGNVATVKEIPGFFDEKPIKVCGESLTLDQLEGRLRKLGDPRIHGALVGGARSCPPLRREPFMAHRIDEQLNDQCRRWLDDNLKNRASERMLLLSETFKWFAEDFNVQPFGGARGFVKKFSRPRGLIRDLLNRMPAVEIGYLPHDWRLNQSRDVNPTHSTAGSGNSQP
jgi:hypothetical protein